MGAFEPPWSRHTHESFWIRPCNPLPKILDQPLQSHPECHILDITIFATNYSVHSGPGGNVLLSTDDYSVGEHILTITATDVCLREAADVQTFITPEPMSKCCIIV